MAKRGGREGRLKLRASAGVHDPAPRGPVGGTYKPLTDAQIDRIWAAALELLDSLGMGEVPERLANQCLAKGAHRLANDRIGFPPSMVERIVAGAASELTLHGRDPARTITVGGDRVHFGTGGAAVQTLDIDTGTYRPSTLRDLYDLARMADRLDTLSWFTRPNVATDISDTFDLDLNTVYALLRGTTKPIATSFFVADYVEPIAAMMALAGDFKARPWLFAHVSPIISPLRYGEDAVDVALECMRLGIPLNCITGAQSGATGPAPLAGFLATSLAETLASLIMVNVFEPGYPMIFGNWPFVIDLRSGAFTGAGGETAVMNAATAQMINWLGLPSGVAACMSDAKVPDAQMGLENGVTAMATALAGGNMIFESAGMMASLLGVSFEAMLISCEMHSLVLRVMRGVEVTDDTLNLDAIRASVMGDGHFLGGADTLAAMERDYFYPALSDRQTPTIWAETGAHDMWTRANARAREMLAAPDPGYVDAALDAEIRKRYNILL